MIGEKIIDRIDEMEEEKKNPNDWLVKDAELYSKGKISRYYFYKRLGLSDEILEKAKRFDRDKQIYCETAVEMADLYIEYCQKFIDGEITQTHLYGIRDSMKMDEEWAERIFKWVLKESGNELYDKFLILENER